MFELPSSADIVLDHLLAVLDIGVTHFTVCDVRDGWGMRFDVCKTASLHYCLAGVGTLAVHCALPIQLEPHTFVLLPPGGAYRLESASPKRVQLEHRARLCGMSSHESVPTLTVGEGQQGIATACGELRVGLAGGHMRVDGDLTDTQTILHFVVMHGRPPAHYGLLITPVGEREKPSFSRQTLVADAVHESHDLLELWAQHPSVPEIRLPLFGSRLHFEYDGKHERYID